MQKIAVKVYWEGRGYDDESERADKEVISSLLSDSEEIWYGSCDCGGVFANSKNKFDRVVSTRHGESSESDDEDICYPLEKADCLEEAYLMNDF